MAVRQPTVKHTRYTVKGLKLPTMKTSRLGPVKKAVSMRGGLRTGKSITTKVASPLKPRTHL